MHAPFYNRRRFLISAGLTAATTATLGVQGVLSPARAAGLAASQTMRGGSNNYRPNAPLVEKLGDGFHISGEVRLAGQGQPIQNARIQIWAATTIGGEREPLNHGSVMTDANGQYHLEMHQIVPNFGQPHAHLAYDDGHFKTVFLRPVMPSARDTSLKVDFVLERA